MKDTHTQPSLDTPCPLPQVEGNLGVSETKVARCRPKFRFPRCLSQLNSRTFNDILMKDQWFFRTFNHKTDISHKTSIKALSLIESPMNHCQDNGNQWIDDIYHNLLLSFRDSASKTLDYRHTPSLLVMKLLIIIGHDFLIGLDMSAMMKIKSYSNQKFHHQ